MQKIIGMILTVAILGGLLGGCYSRYCNQCPTCNQQTKAYK